MIEQTNVEKLHRAAALNNDGHTDEAAKLCREVLTVEPNNLTALLWLIYSSSEQHEIYNALTRAYSVDPNHPSVHEAIHLYNTMFPSQPTAATQETVQSQGVAHTVVPPQVQTETEEGQPEKRKPAPLGEPVKDGSNFFMTQTGGIFLVGIFFLIGSVGTFLWSSGIMNSILDEPTTGRYRRVDMVSSARADLVMIISGLSSIGFAGLLIFLLLDILKPPVKSYGEILGKRKQRIEQRSRAGGVSEDTSYWQYIVDFIADENSNGIVVQLKLTENQFNAAQKSKKAYVEYSKRTGYCRIYQPMR